MYSSYTAASFAREYDLAERAGVNLEGALTWAFEFEDQPYFAGFRVLATNGIDLPVLNVFRMFSKMGGRRVRRRARGRSLDAILQGGVRGAPDVSALAASTGTKLSVLVWHYHDDDVPGPDAEVALDVSGLPAAAGPVCCTTTGSTAAQQRVRGLEADGLAPAADGRAVRRAGPGVRLALLDSPGWLRAEGGNAQAPDDAAAAGGLAAPVECAPPRPRCRRASSPLCLVTAAGRALSSAREIRDERDRVSGSPPRLSLLPAYVDGFFARIIRSAFSRAFTVVLKVEEGPSLKVPTLSFSSAWSADFTEGRRSSASYCFVTASTDSRNSVRAALAASKLFLLSASRVFGSAFLHRP